MLVTASVEAHENIAFLDALNSAKRAVIPAPLRIVLYSHDPCPDPQFKMLGDRQPISVVLQLSSYLGIENHRIGGQSVQAGMVVTLCGGFRRREKERLSRGSMWPHAPLVEKGNRLRDALAQPDLAQDFNEVPLILSVDELKRDRGDRNVLQGMSTEGIRGVVAQPMEEGAGVALNHWRKLEEVAHHDDLDAPEGAVISPDRPQPCIDGVDEIDADHRNLINDEALHAPVENAKPLPIRQSLRVKEKRRELEKRVDGLRLCIQRSDGRRCGNRLPFTTRTLPKVADELCFPCSCSANHQHDRRTSVYRSEGLAHPGGPP